MIRRAFCIIAAFLLLGGYAAWGQDGHPTVSIGAPTTVPSSTVAGLPVCGASTTGWVYLVTDSLTPILAATVIGGGAVSVLVRCNAVNWIVG